MLKPQGIEKCGTFFSEAAGRKLLEYDFQTEDGDLFSTVALTLAEARSQRDMWLAKKATAPSTEHRRTP